MNFMLIQGSVILFVVFTFAFAASDTEFICFNLDKDYKDMGTATENLRACGVESLKSMADVTNIKKIMCAFDKFNALTDLKLPKPAVMVELMNYYTESDKLEVMKHIYKSCTHPEHLADVMKFSECIFTKVSDMCDDVQINGPI